MKTVAYYRVSTQKQGKSGLGLEAQQAAVEAFTRSNGGRILKAFTEIESGKKTDLDRPELQKALAHCRAAKATLVIAKLDRLARSVAFLSALMESGTPFKACDCPYADEFTIHILSAVAQKEAKDISTRTKAALAAYKARGGVLGSARPECRHNLGDAAKRKGRQLGAIACRANARQAYADVLPLMTELREARLTYRAIAERLNLEGFTSRRGRPWNHVQVRLCLERQRADSLRR